MALLDKLHNLPTLNEMKGGLGEQLAKYYSKAMTDAFVLHDVLIDGADGMTSQIDLLLIGRTGIYVVEVKMYTNARIYGDGKKSTWYYYLGGKKYEIYSPIKQNKKHIKYLKEFLKDFGDVPCFSVVTIVCEDIKVQNVNENMDYIDTVVATTMPAMNRGIEALAKDKPDVLTPEKQREIYEYILNNQHIGKEARTEHKEKVKEMKQAQEDMKDQHICPYCKTPMVLRKGKYGEFYGCSNYPKCRYVQKV